MNQNKDVYVSKGELQLSVEKVKLSLCLTKYHAMKMYWGVEV